MNEATSPRSEASESTDQKPTMERRTRRRMRDASTRPVVVSVADGMPRPRWRGRLHAGGFALAAVVGPALLWLATSRTAKVAVTVYLVSMLGLFGTSAGYHLLARTERAQQIMRRLDHSAIFVKIAGTYTPVCLLALPPRWGRSILAAIWLAAAVGIAVKLFGGARLLRLSNALYLAFGWIAVLALPVIIDHLTWSEFALLAVGGMMYTIGAILFYCKRPRLRPMVFGYHEVWHGFTVVAAVAHFAMVWSVAG